jgi:hypothetical protein
MMPWDTFGFLKFAATIEENRVFSYESGDHDEDDRN